MSGIQYLSILANDLDDLAKISVRARTHQTLNSLTEHGESRRLHDLVSRPDAVGFKICLGRKTVGAFFLTWHEQGQSKLLDVFIDPEFQGRGIGGQAWNFITGCYPSVQWIVEMEESANEGRYFFESVCGFAVKASHETGLMLTWQRRRRAEVPAPKVPEPVAV